MKMTYALDEQTRKRGGGRFDWKATRTFFKPARVAAVFTLVGSTLFLAKM